MPYIKHPRHITKEQFADNTTVDGSRIDSAMESIERHFNSVPQGDVRSKWLPVPYVMSWSPNRSGATLANTHHFPWMPSVNNNAQTVGAAPDFYLNTLRVKGFNIPDVSPTEESTEHLQFHWTTSFNFDRPAVITHLDVMLIIDSSSDPAAVRAYNNDFQYGATPPHGELPLSNSRDFNFCIHVDSPTGLEDRQLNDIEAMRHNFSLNLSSVTNKPWPNAGLFTDFNPGAFPGAGLQGMFDPVEMDIPVHRNSRVRLSLTIPPIIDVADQYVSSWSTQPWYKQQYHITMHTLEELV